MATRDASAVSPVASARPRHHGNHTKLIARVHAAELLADVDAIIVPTARHVAALRESFRLGEMLGCPVVALCSRWSSAEHVHHEARAHNAHLFATDIGIDSALPTFATSKRLANTRFASPSDLSLKRNVGLALAKMVGWHRVVFLDDDITVADPDDARRAAGLLSSYNMVALENVGFPDNSVVCHAIRRVARVADTGVTQSSFVGGGAMVVPVDRTTSFFPNIYNEDWFFMLSDKHISPIAVTGTVRQSGYDPYAGARRARGEELGDCLAEGVYSILDNRGCVQDADRAFWGGFLDDRRQLIERVLAAVPALKLDAAENDRMVTALKAALGRRELITPQLCVDYLDAWATDRDVWGIYLADLPKQLSPRRALQHLGLATQIALPR